MAPMMAREMRPPHDERGMSVTVLGMTMITALILTAGLVIDGGQKVTATSRAQTAAAGATRVAGNASATQQLAGRDPTGAAVLAARSYLAGQPGVRGSVDLAGGVVTVTASATEPTIFVSAIGIDSVTGRGRSQANVVATGERR